MNNYQHFTLCFISFDFQISKLFSINASEPKAIDWEESMKEKKIIAKHFSTDFYTIFSDNYDLTGMETLT